MHFFSCAFSVSSSFILGHSLKNNFSVFHISGNVPYINLLLLYILLNSPVQIIEYIYLLNNRAYRIFQYGLYTFLSPADIYYYSINTREGYYLVNLRLACNYSCKMGMAYCFAEADIPK